MARAIFAVLVAGGLVTLGFMLDAGEPDKLWWWSGFVPFAGWALVPYAAAALSAQRLRSSRRSLWVLLVAAALLSGSAAALYEKYGLSAGRIADQVLEFLSQTP